MSGNQINSNRDWSFMYSWFYLLLFIASILNFGAINILKWYFSVRRNLSCALDAIFFLSSFIENSRMFSSVPGLYLLDASNTFLSCNNQYLQMLLNGTSGWEAKWLPVEKYSYNVLDKVEDNHLVFPWRILWYYIRKEFC